MTEADRLSLIFKVGQKVCSFYVGFSKTEIAYCKKMSSWMHISSLLFSDNEFQTMITFSMNPLYGVIEYFQLFVGCIVSFRDEESLNARLQTLLNVIDNQNALDSACKNTKILRALLSMMTSFNLGQSSMFIGTNARRVLAHIFKKFPDLLKSNILRSSSKSRHLRFTEEDIEKYF